jgi:hypothetical protein
MECTRFNPEDLMAKISMKIAKTLIGVAFFFASEGTFSSHTLG